MVTEIRVLVVDYLPIYGHGLISILESTKEISARTETSEIDRIPTIAHDAKTDVVILGAVADPQEIADLSTRLLLASPRVHLLVVVDPDEGSRIGELMRFGSINLLSRRASPVEAIESVRAVVAGRSLVPADIAPRMIDELSVAMRQAESRWLPGGLTRRELEVLSYVSDGLSNREVARTLHISENTVKNHMRNIHEKMGVKTRTEAVVKAARDGLLGSRLARLGALRNGTLATGTRIDSVNSQAD